MDSTWSKLRLGRSTLLSEKEEWELRLRRDEKAQDTEYKRKVQKTIDKKVHALHIQDLKLDAREAELNRKPEEAARLYHMIDEEEAAFSLTNLKRLVRIYALLHRLAQVMLVNDVARTAQDRR